MTGPVALDQQSALTKTVDDRHAQAGFETLQSRVTDDDGGPAHPVPLVENAEKLQPLCVRTKNLIGFIQNQQIHLGEGVDNVFLARAILSAPGISYPVNELPCTYLHH